MVQMEVAAADRRVGNSTDYVCWLGNGGHRDLVYADVFVAVLAEREHGFAGSVGGLVGRGGRPVAEVLFDFVGDEGVYGCGYT